MGSQFELFLFEASFPTMASKCNSAIFLKFSQNMRVYSTTPVFDELSEWTEVDSFWGMVDTRRFSSNFFWKF